ncbi:MAG: EpsG family protein [Muribaculaceae bacterium]|nr:EpsG family protein [Muribaculaceae bacterium]
MLCAYLIIIFGIRYKVGVDTMNYMGSYDLTPTYDQFKTIDWTTSLREPGYLVISILCRSVTKEFWLLQLVMAAITNIGIFIFISRACRNPFVGLLLYYFMACGYFTTDILRESAAIGIFLYNYRNIHRKKWGNYYGLCILSICFHYSALITLIIPFFIRLHANWVYWTIFIGLTLSAPLLENINNLITVAALVSRTSGYIAQGENVNLNFRIANLIHLFFPTLLVIIFNKRYNLKYANMNMVWLQLLFCAGVFSIPIIFQRLTNYTLLFVVTGLSQLLSAGKIITTLKIGIIGILCISYSFYYYTNLYRWYPYVSILNKRTIPEREDIWWHDFGENKL